MSDKESRSGKARGAWGSPDLVAQAERAARASIDLPKPTPEQAEYLLKVQAQTRRDYDEKTVVGGPRRRNA